jgi:hypothetical protein
MPHLKHAGDFRRLRRNEDCFAKARGLETGPGRIRETTAEKRKSTATIMPKATAAPWSNQETLTKKAWRSG